MPHRFSFSIFGERDRRRRESQNTDIQASSTNTDIQANNTAELFGSQRRHADDPAHESNPPVALHHDWDRLTPLQQQHVDELPSHQSPYAARSSVNDSQPINVISTDVVLNSFRPTGRTNTDRQANHTARQSGSQRRHTDDPAHETDQPVGVPVVPANIRQQQHTDDLGLPATDPAHEPDQPVAVPVVPANIRQQQHTDDVGLPATDPAHQPDQPVAVPVVPANIRQQQHTDDVGLPATPAQPLRTHPVLNNYTTQISKIHYYVCARCNERDLKQVNRQVPNCSRCVHTDKFSAANNMISQFKVFYYFLKTVISYISSPVRASALRFGT